MVALDRNPYKEAAMLAPCLTVPEVAKLLRVTPASLYARRFRTRLGLRPVRMGGRVRFLEEDVRGLLKRKRD
jgi:predicted DNA-binding transcriptional regulator AlpA